MPYIIIAAVANNNVLGNNNKLPWHYAEDMKFFKETTKGGVVVMGRKTYESIGNKKGLAGRTNVVISRQTRMELELPDTVGLSFDVAAMKRSWDVTAETKDIYIIGGAEIYRQCASFADKLIVTRIYEDYPGDTFFPALSASLWALESLTPSTQGNPLEFKIFNRRRS